MPITINQNGGGMTFAGEDGTSLFQAVALRSALKLHKVGIKINRHTRTKDLFMIASQITGKVYKAKAFDDAMADLTAWIEQAKAQTVIIKE